MIARGSAFCGSLTSSPAVATASRPMNEKKMVPAAALTPEKPDAKKLSKWSAWNAVRPMTTNSTSTPSLISTMIALTRADSRGAPEQQERAQHDQDHGRQVDQAARRDAVVTGIGETDSACGSRTPNSFSSSSLK